jgi:phage/conjugal plasmid C-4 type zinc finger TraR family protein
MALKKEQKIFIRNNIRVLGTIDEVNRFYSQNDMVSEYAKSVAPGLLLQSKRSKKPIKNGSDTWAKSEKTNYFSSNTSHSAISTNKNSSKWNCIDCGEIIPEARLEISPQTNRCVKCQQALEGKNPNTYKRKIDEGLAGSREDHKRLKAREWGAMINRNK